MFDAVLDLSGHEALFGVKNNDGGKLLINAGKPMRGRTAASLAEWVVGLLQENHISLSQITRWNVGAGPGSFTGMRLAAAFVAGLTAQKPGISTRCVPSAVGLAYGGHYRENDRVAALLDGRNQEIILYSMVCVGSNFKPDGVTEILDRQSAAEYFSRCHFAGLVALASEKEAVEKVVSNEIVAKVEYKERLSLEALLDADYIPWDNDLTKLVYIRPAVHIQNKP